MARLAQDVDLASGALRGVTGPLVKVPIRSSADYSTSTAGTASVNLSQNGVVGNTDSTRNAVQLAVPAGPPNGAILRTILSGRVIGVRTRRDVSAPDFYDVVIDGVAYRVQDPQARYDNQVAGQSDFEAVHIVASNLPDRRHTVSIVVPCDKTGGSTRTLTILGFVAERGRGYNDIAPSPRVGVVGSATSLPVALASIPAVSDPYSVLSFYNTDTAARTVTVTDSSNNVYAVRAIAAGGNAEVRFAGPRYLPGWKWKADTASVVNAWGESA